MSDTINNFIDPQIGYTGVPRIDSSFNKTASVSSTSNTLTDLMSYTATPPSLFLEQSGSNDGFKIIACGTFAANGNTKTVNLLFGATTLATVTGAFNGGAWRIEAEVFRITSATQTANAVVWAGTTPVISTTNSSPAESTDTSNVVIKAQGQGTTTGDVVETSLSIQNI